jgi:Predicted flavin-nucleotide-binding protein
VGNFMQNRMKTHQLNEEEITSLLEAEQVGRLATINPDGTPYITPVHYVFYNQKIYIHGLIRGQKMKNITENPNVCFEIDQFEKLILPEEKSPCDVNTQYQSVIITGTAKIVEDDKLKAEALNLIIEKYTPSLSGAPFGNAIKATGVTEMDIKEMTGKYYE